MGELSKRQGYGCPNGYRAGNNGYCYSNWDSWGRWVVLGLIIIGALIIFFLFSCLSSRRRRKMGYAPYRGTGWATAPRPTGGPPPPETYNSQQPYYASNNYNQGYNSAPAPPAYGSSQDWYGNRQNDVELQSPQNVYRPPQGPPPAKGAIIR